jgi:hypothetical protein
LKSAISRQRISDPETDELLHEIIRPSRSLDVFSELKRLDFSAPEEFLQGAVIEIPANHSFRPHVHLERQRTLVNLRAQEAWVVISGTVEVDYFTDYGVFILTEKLIAGDVTISFRGGHGYRTLTSDALVYEFKSGPYEGQQIDKIFID